MKIYIAGKITGYPGHKEKFRAAEDKLKKYGHATINPAKLNDILGDNFTHTEYMKICYSLIDLCDAIFLLKNWNDSKGAKMEKDYALNKGMDIYFEEVQEVEEWGNL